MIAVETPNGAMNTAAMSWMPGAIVARVMVRQIPQMSWISRKSRHQRLGKDVQAQMIEDLGEFGQNRSALTIMR
jgi:hypothetical protein